MCFSIIIDKLLKSCTRNKWRGRRFWIFIWWLFVFFFTMSLKKNWLCKPDACMSCEVEREAGGWSPHSWDQVLCPMVYWFFSVIIFTKWSIYLVFKNLLSTKTSNDCSLSSPQEYWELTNENTAWKEHQASASN